VDDLNVECKQFYERTHVFSAGEPIGKLTYYLRWSRRFGDKINFISYNSRGYDHSSAAIVSGTEMHTSIYNGWYKNS